MALFVTAFDQGFWIKGHTLLKSFAIQKDKKDRIFSFCLDSETFEFFSKQFPQLADFVPASDTLPEEVLSLRNVRNPTEYACTVKPFFLKHAMHFAEEGEWVFWIDSDAQFFAGSEQIYAGATGDVFLSHHRFNHEFLSSEPIVGSFNGGLVGFKKSREGKSALDWWAARCLEDCPNLPSTGKYLDQKYLEGLNQRFLTHVDRSRGVNMAPWNLSEGDILEKRDRYFYLGESPLVFFHFQGLKIYHPNWVDFFGGNWVVPKGIRVVYDEHLKGLRESMITISELRSLPRKNFQRVPRKMFLARLFGLKRGLSNLRYLHA